MLFYLTYIKYIYLSIIFKILEVIEVCRLRFHIHLYYLTSFPSSLSSFTLPRPPPPRHPPSLSLFKWINVKKAFSSADLFWNVLFLSVCVHLNISIFCILEPAYQMPSWKIKVSTWSKAIIFLHHRENKEAYKNLF